MLKGPRKKKEEQFPEKKKRKEYPKVTMTQKFLPGIFRNLGEKAG